MWVGGLILGTQYPDLHTELCLEVQLYFKQYRYRQRKVPQCSGPKVSHTQIALSVNMVTALEKVEFAAFSFI